MSEQNWNINLQSIPEFKQAYDLCVVCKITDKLSPHVKFIDYVDMRARRKMGSPDQDYRPEYYFPALKMVIESYIEALETGKVLQYEANSGEIVDIDIVSEFRELKKKAGNKTADYLTWTVAKLYEILVLKESAIKISRE